MMHPNRFLDNFYKFDDMPHTSIYPTTVYATPEMIKRILGNTPIRFYPTDKIDIGISIKDVRFSPTATIVFWSDNNKTVVKAQGGEPFDAEKGLMACIIKRITGNTGRYNELFKKYIKEDK